MTTFREFADWLFPGDEIPSRLPNPSLPREAETLLEEVSCKTGVEVNWLAKSARLVLDGLAGAQCLWFLHGARGKIATSLDVPTDLWGRLNALAQAEGHRLTKKLHEHGSSNYVRVKPNWGSGEVIESTLDEHGYGTIKTRNIRLGVWLKKLANDNAAADLAKTRNDISKEEFTTFANDLLKAFETRQLPHFEWEISCHPFDVLTMSFNRPWTSCMRPGGAAELGPLTDMAAGSAVMFFYRPEADKPCGRIILRPVAESDGRPAILGGGVVYGVGPGQKALRFGHDVTLLENKDLKPVLDPIIEPLGVTMSRFVGLCDYGYRLQALTRYIYSDNNNAYCTQEDGSYNDAYATLVGLPWPESKLDLDDLAVRAGEVAEDISPRAAKLTFAQAARAVAEQTMESLALGGLIDYECDLMNPDRNNIDLDAVYEEAGMVSPDPDSRHYGDVHHQHANQAWEIHIEVLQEMYARIPDGTPVKVVVYDNLSKKPTKDLDRTNAYVTGYLHDLPISEDEFIKQYIPAAEQIIEDGYDVRFAIIPDDLWGSEMNKYSLASALIPEAIALVDVPYRTLYDKGYFNFNW